MSTTTGRKQAPRLARPAARYWKGKAPKGVSVAADDSDSEASDDEQRVREDGDVPIGGDQDILAESGGDEEEEEEMKMGSVKGKAPEKKKGMNVTLKDVNISRDGRVIVAGREESGRTLEEAEESSSEEDDDEAPSKPGLAPKTKAESDESSEYESDSEEEEEPKVQFRPVFVPKRARITIAEKEALIESAEQAQQRKEAEAEERRKQSHDLVAESIRRELAEKEKEELVPDVDDTDGLDPAAEFEAWRLRELGRIKRDKEAELQREEEREEIERRRALPEEQRMKEDLERAQKLRAEKPKGQQRFLQKYFHKGAFHQDDEILKKHDYTEATTSTVDVTLLPKVMQVRNFGKRSRTKYTHLVDQDTTVTTGGFGGTKPVKAGGTSTDQGGCFLCGGPHLKKDCPQNTGLLTAHGTGPNGAPTGPRQWGAPPSRPPDNGSSWRDRDHGEDRDRRSWKRDDYGDRPPPPQDVDRRSSPKRDRDRDQGGYGSRHDRSRSRSRERARDGGSGRDRERGRRSDYPERDRRRSRSREGRDEGYREKRRRVD